MRPSITLPLFVRAGSILPLGVPVLSTSETAGVGQNPRLPRRGSSFTLYQDDGRTYAYEKGDSKITNLHWNDAAGKLTHDGASAWPGPDDALVEIVSPK
jgi:alpha-D-xyloside xylohydrolase